MPRVVANQRERFENDELFRKLSRDLEVRYTGFRDRPMAERRLCLQAECRDGHATIAIIGLGINLNLSFYTDPWRQRLDESPISTDCVDFAREPNKVHLKSQFILNGVCVTWKGWLDLRRLDGVGRFEFDTERAQIEDALLREDVGCCSGGGSSSNYDDIHSRQILADRLHCPRPDDKLQEQNQHQQVAQLQQQRSQLSAAPSTADQRSNGSCSRSLSNTSSSSSSSSSSSTDPRNYVMCYDDVSG